MNQYTEKEYKEAFGVEAWNKKVLEGNEGFEIESVYATSNGNIFMVITKDVI